jgi:hypothetical protein
MKKFFLAFLIIIFLNSNSIIAKTYLYILNDSCINELFQNANSYFSSTEITPIRDSRGIILRFELKNPEKECESLTQGTYQNIKLVGEFLAKIKNPAIIEVHLEDFQVTVGKNLKNWEISTIIANNIESEILRLSDKSEENKVKSVGYGEFLPSVTFANNPPNKGGKDSNRVDIIILCNISGE